MPNVTMEFIRNIVMDLIKSEKKDAYRLQRVAHTKIDAELSKQIQEEKSKEAKEDGILSVSVAVLGPEDKAPVTHAEGLKDPLADKKEQVTSDTLYNLGSISKLILMMIAVRLIQADKLNFTDTINKFITDAELPGASEITIQHLLGHRSGLKDCDFIAFKESDPLTKLLKLKAEGWLGYDLAGAPGENFYYANINFVILAKIIQKVMGKNLQECFKELIGDPLGLKNVFVIEQSDTEGRYATGYKPNPEATHLVNASEHFMFGATGFRATPSDLVKLISQFFKNNEFISPDLRRTILGSIKDETFELVTKTDSYTWPCRMGLSIDEREVKLHDGRSVKIYGHGGWQDSNAAYLAFNPEDGTAYCCCVSKTQGMPRLHAKSQSYIKPLIFGATFLGALGLFAASRGVGVAEHKLSAGKKLGLRRNTYSWCP